MNQEAALRREARRKKILENSVSRLQLIEKVNYSSAKPTFQSSEEPQPKTFQNIEENLEFLKNESDSKFSDVIKENKELKEISELLLQNEIKQPEEEEEREDDVEIEPEDGSAEVVGAKTDYWVLRFIFEKRLHYVLLAILVHFLFFLDLGYLFYESIFCPFYTVKIIELISRRGEKEEFQLVLFFLLAGLPKVLQNFFTNYLTKVAALFSDLLLYIFVFILGTKVVNIQV